MTELRQFRSEGLRSRGVAGEDFSGGGNPADGEISTL